MSKFLKIQTRVILILLCVYGVFLIFGKIRQSQSYRYFQTGERALRSNDYEQSAAFLKKSIELSPRSRWSSTVANELAFIRLVLANDAQKTEKTRESIGNWLSSSVIISAMSVILLLLIVGGVAHIRRLKEVRGLEEHIGYLKNVEHRIRMKALPSLDGASPETFDGTADYQNYIQYYQSSECVLLAKCLLAEFYYLLLPDNPERLQTLEQSYTEFWRKYPNSAFAEEIIQKLANFYFFYQHKYEVARDMYRKLIEKYPQSRWVKIAQARIRLIEENPYDNFEPLSYYIKAERYYELKKYPESIEKFTELINKYPNTPLAIEAQYNIADIYMYKTNELERAISEYQIIVNGHRQGPFADRAQYKVGECYKKIQKFPEAIEAYEKFIAQYPSSEFLDYALYYMGYCYEQIHETKKALETYQQIIANFSTSIWVVVAESRIVALSAKE